MNSEFNWWLLILGAVIGAGVVWLILADSRRREIDLAERERESEARWIGVAMRDAGRRVSDADALDILRLHAAYLAAPPPDDPDEAEDMERLSPEVDPSRIAAPPGPRSAGEHRTPMAHPIGSSGPIEGGRRDT